ncbi:MAG: 3-dehydroquinate synthase [Hyphomonadaceae bacterium]|nr:3-dehydroquinate synthase [Hyphomonadaceae bacterium]
MTHTIHVALGARAYDVHVGEGLIGRAGALVAPLAPTKRVFVVTDENVARHHGAALTASLAAAGLTHIVITLPPGEQTKSFHGLELLTRNLLQAGVHRRDLIIALGGGVIGDLTGLAAGLVKRGVDFVQIPTTLLSQVDSSVGGKTAIDTPEGKNLIGLIHQPRLVLADTGVLATLPPRELRAGYAEIVKIGLINDAAFFAWCEANVAAVLAREPHAIGYAIATAIAAKARVVEADETEQGDRALLNLGHTFAHALEAHGGYDQALVHGEAVAAGMALAFAHSAQLGLCGADEAARVRAHLDAAGFITDLRTLPGAPFDPGTLLALMASDKKAEAGSLKLILARAIGAAFVHKAADAEKLGAFLTQESQ